MKPIESVCSCSGVDVNQVNYYDDGVERELQLHRKSNIDDNHSQNNALRSKELQIERLLHELNQTCIHFPNSPWGADLERQRALLMEAHTLFKVKVIDSGHLHKWLDIVHAHLLHIKRKQQQFVCAEIAQNQTRLSDRIAQMRSTYGYGEGLEVVLRRVERQMRMISAHLTMGQTDVCILADSLQMLENDVREAMIEMETLNGGNTSASVPPKDPRLIVQRRMPEPVQEPNSFLKLLQRTICSQMLTFASECNRLTKYALQHLSSSHRIAAGQIQKYINSSRMLKVLQETVCSMMEHDLHGLCDSLTRKTLEEFFGPPKNVLCETVITHTENGTDRQLKCRRVGETKPAASAVLRRNMADCLVWKTDDGDGNRSRTPDDHDKLQKSVGDWSYHIEAVNSDDNSDFEEYESGPPIPGDGDKLHKSVGDWSYSYLDAVRPHDDDLDYEDVRSRP